VPPHITPNGYQHKFANFIKMCEDARRAGFRTVIVSSPWMLGDTYDEMVESLSRLREAGLQLSLQPCPTDDR
jgi:hypothetical protein